MSVDKRYENCLGQMLSLLQEGVIRLLTQKPIDTRKFQQYFTAIHAKMIVLESTTFSFATKFSPQLSKLSALFGAEQKTSSLVVDPPIQQPVIPIKSNYQSMQTSRGLKQIVQEEEAQGQWKGIPSKRRSQTANGYRQKRFEGRPMTGQLGKTRYASKTIEVPYNPLTEEPELNNGGVNMAPVRMDFYNQLARIKEDRAFPLFSYNLPNRKKTKSQQKWVHKIQRLL